jgi:hypothetical protein
VTITRTREPRGEIVQTRNDMNVISERGEWGEAGR